MAHSHYPGFNTLAEQDAWDDYSRSVVLKRLQPAKPTLLRQDEIDTVRAIARNLLYESREKLLDFVVAHIDSQLASPIGESERKSMLPPQDVLVRRGLAALNGAAMEMESKPFHLCKPETQAHLLQTLQKGQAALPAVFADVPQKDLFKKLLLLSVDAFSSHPAIWSEMGYPGPAYPRGYYRIERGLHDPWEPVAASAAGSMAESVAGTVAESVAGSIAASKAEPMAEQGGGNNGSS